MPIAPQCGAVLVNGLSLRVFDDVLRGAVRHHRVTEEQSGGRELE